MSVDADCSSKFTLQPTHESWKCGSQEAENGNTICQIIKQANSCSLASCLADLQEGLHKQSRSCFIIIPPIALLNSLLLHCLHRTQWKSSSHCGGCLGCGATGQGDAQCRTMTPYLFTWDGSYPQQSPHLQREGGADGLEGKVDASVRGGTHCPQTSLGSSALPYLYPCVSFFSCLN